MKIFQSTTICNGKTKTKWYYSYKDSVGKLHTRVCKDCITEEDANEYVSKLDFVSNEQYLIKNIASTMFLPDSDNLNRLKDFGKKISEETRKSKLKFISYIIEAFGDCDIRELKISTVEQFLINDKKHSGSWKNSFLETFGTIYDETVWVCDKPVIKPKFNKFARNSKKADILSTEELNILFEDYRNWENYDVYLLFYLIASCGLRLSEARGLTVNQFMIKEQLLLVNGFCKYDGRKTNYNKKGSIEDRKLRVTPLPQNAIFKVIHFFYQKKIFGNDFLFTDSNGKPYAASHLRLELKHALQKCDIKINGRKICPHSLRFTYVTRMRRGCSVEDVKKIVGHNSTQMTEYYTRFSIEEMKQSINETFDEANKIFS